MQLAWFKGDTCKDSEDISQSREFYSRLNEGGGGGAKIRRFKAFFPAMLTVFR